MKFKNITEDTRVVPSLGFSVAAGEWTPDVSDDDATGFALQTDTWEPADAPAGPVAVPAAPITPDAARAAAGLPPITETPAAVPVATTEEQS